MEIRLIHRHPELLDDCCDLINMEWPRSKTARLRTLQNSCDNLPTNLVLLQHWKLIGHSKLSPIPSIEDACFVESVVIHPNYRGQGLGKKLMLATEDFAQSIGLSSIYLSTTDKREFYKKLGYEECAPVNVYGCGLSHLFNKCVNVSRTTKETPSPQSNDAIKVPPAAPPPPPPPPPPMALPINCSSSFQTKKVYMRKLL